MSIQPYQLMVESLLLRLPTHHSKHNFIVNAVGKERAGYYGEKKLMYPISKIDFSHDLLFQLRLPLNGAYFQMDSLVLTPRFLLIMEAKNYSDDVAFDSDFYRVVQKRGDEVRVYDDPVLQVEEQRYLLQVWMEMFNYPDIPIETLVVMTNPSFRPSGDSRYKEKIIPVNRLSSRLREISSQYSRQIISRKEISRLGHAFLDAHEPYVTYPDRRFGIVEHEWNKGVFCMECGRLGMRMMRMRWECNRCGSRSGDAHINAIKDRYLLVGPTLTNAEFREMTGVKSVYTASRMLGRENYNKYGKNKGRKHRLEYSYEKDFGYLEYLVKLYQDRQIKFKNKQINF
ncbi:nuclease-related domain-containing protein [Filobacillus milosensis]|uniref:nuclease-related domain-containing protein n=1 Tax=Filobacillus milosensis TaxID=94137 RepID=UPI001890B7BC|nr:nuclease-related domain-containing protein [Filobacillus milosensis]